MKSGKPICERDGHPPALPWAFEWQAFKARLNRPADEPAGDASARREDEADSPAPRRRA